MVKHIKRIKFVKIFLKTWLIKNIVSIFKMSFIRMRSVIKLFT